MRISDGSSDVCSSDVATGVVHDFAVNRGELQGPASWGNHGGLERPVAVRFDPAGTALYVVDFGVLTSDERGNYPRPGTGAVWRITRTRSEEHTSELQSLMRNSYAVFCLKKKP